MWLSNFICSTHITINCNLCSTCNTLKLQKHDNTSLFLIDLIYISGVYLGFFKWAGTPKSKWAGTAPPQSGQALKKWGGTKKKPAAGADFFTKKWAGSGGAQKSGQAVGGTQNSKVGGALFKKVQKWGGTRSSAPHCLD